MGFSLPFRATAIVLFNCWIATHTVAAAEPPAKTSAKPVSPVSETTASTPSASASPAAPAGTPAFKLNFKTETLGSLDLGKSILAIRASSPEGCHIALVSKGSEPNTNAVSLDGTSGPEFDGILNRTPVFSPDATRLVYGARINEHWIVFEHGKSDPAQCPKWQRIIETSFSFSADGKHFAYVAKRDKWYIVADGKEYGPYEDIVSLPIFSTNGKRLVYGVVLQGQQRLIDQGQPGPVYEQVGAATLSQDGARLAYCVQKNGHQFVTVDGKRGELYGGVFGESLRFSPDGKHIAYAVQKGMRRIVVIDGKEESDFGTIVGSSIQFSPDSQRLAYIARNRDNWRAVVDGKAGPEFTKLDHLIFSADSRHYAYLAGDQTSRFIINDGKQGPEFPEVAAESLTFAPKGASSAYIAVRNDKKALIMLNGKPMGEYDDVGPLAFSPDGKHLAYHANTGNALSIYIDGHQVYGPVTIVCEPAFLRDGRLQFIILKEKTLCRVTSEALE